MVGNSLRSRKKEWGATARLGQQRFGEAVALSQFTGVYNIGNSPEMRLLLRPKWQPVARHRQIPHHHSRKR
jgi:hypothetical protein